MRDATVSFVAESSEAHAGNHAEQVFFHYVTIALHVVIPLGPQEQHGRHRLFVQEGLSRSEEQ